MKISMDMLQRTLLKLLAKPGMDRRLREDYLPKTFVSAFPEDYQPTHEDFKVTMSYLQNQYLAFVDDQSQSGVENWSLVLTEGGLAKAQDIARHYLTEEERKQIDVNKLKTCILLMLYDVKMGDKVAPHMRVRENLLLTLCREPDRSGLLPEQRFREKYSEAIGSLSREGQVTEEPIPTGGGSNLYLTSDGLESVLFNAGKSDGSDIQGVRDRKEHDPKVQKELGRRNMPHQALVYTILIASPSDVAEERRVIPEVIQAWNAVNFIDRRVALLPVLWETHSTPEMGDRPQAIINRQLVETSNILIGVFWTRLGTPTGQAESGTVEEIEEFMKAGKPVLLYFSSVPLPPDNIDLEQYSKVQALKEKYKKEGVIATYESVDQLRGLLRRHLSDTIRSMISGGEEEIAEDEDMYFLSEGLESLEEPKADTDAHTEKESLDTTLPDLTISVEEGSRFFRAVSATESTEDKETILRPTVSIRNNDPSDAAITKYKMQVLSPRQYQCQTTELLPAETPVRFRISEGAGRSLHVKYSDGIDKRFLILPGELRTGTLFFKVSHIIDRQYGELECKLEIWTQNDHHASVKFSLPKEGY
ncbi:hypothetical protein ACFL6S_05400 [Candidatus Poribacteria bacterium]